MISDWDVYEVVSVRVSQPAVFSWIRIKPVIVVMPEYQYMKYEENADLAYERYEDRLLLGLERL